MCGVKFFPRKFISTPQKKPLGIRGIAIKIMYFLFAIAYYRKIKDSKPAGYSYIISKVNEHIYQL